MHNRTFSLDCGDLDAAAEHLPMPPRALPTVDEFHPVVAMPGQIVLCVHDETNEQARQYEVPSSLVEECEDGEELADHLRRIVLADFN